MTPGEVHAERLRIWLAALKACDSYNSRAATIVFIRKSEPKLMEDVKKQMNFSSADDVIKWLAE